MRRLLVHVEGQTEEQFVNELLAPYLGARGFESVSARLLGSRRERAFRGGVRPWSGVRQEMARHLARDPGVLAGLMVDYYGMPPQWPGRRDAPSHPVDERAGLVARSLREDFPADVRGRVFPCVLMHEFECFVFVDVDRAVRAWGLEALGAPLRAVRSAFSSPEHINDSPETAPSKRLEGLVTGYQKPLMGALAVLEIGLDRIRAECSSFAGWLGQLEAAGRQP